MPMNISLSQNLALKILFLSVIVALFCAPVHDVRAETVLRVEESVTVASDQVVEEDFYALGGTVIMSGEIMGDMYSTGGSVTVNGPITEDLTVLGGSVQVHGPVRDDVRVIGGEVTIADTVEGDIFVIAGSLNILSSAAVMGDVFFYGGEIEVNGPVTGSLMGSAGRFRVDAAIGGNIDVRAQELVLGDRVTVSGNVRYQSQNELVRAQNAVIEGSVVQNEPHTEPAAPNYSDNIIFFVMNLFAAMVLFFLFRKELQEFVKETVRNYARSSVLGLTAIFIAPVVTVLLMLTLLGFLLGLAGIFVLALLYIISFVLLSVVVGGLLSQIITKDMQINLLWITIGAIVVNIVFLIPIIGPLAVLCGFVVVLGGLLWQAYSLLR